MRPAKFKRPSGFTLIEILTVITVIGILAALLMPALSGAREKGKQIACQSNLHQIGVAIMVYAGDYGSHTPPAYQIDNTGAKIAWYTILTNGNYITTKVLQCPDDRRIPRTGSTPLSYAMVIGYENTLQKYNSFGVGNFWISGSRLTCSYLTNSSVAMVAEYYNSDYGVLPTLEDTGNSMRPFVTSSYDYTSNSKILNGYPPLSMHLRGSPLTGNYLFMDGHVEYVNSLVPGATPGTDPVADRMFPKVPDTPPSFSGTFVPCP